MNLCSELQGNQGVIEIRNTLAYDDDSRLTTAADPLGHISRTEYDSVGQRSIFNRSQRREHLIQV